MFGFGGTQPIAANVAPTLQTAQIPLIISGATKYSDLPETLKAQVDSLQTFIAAQTSLGASLAPLKTVLQPTILVKTHRSSLETVANLLQKDMCAIEDISASCARELANIDLAARFCEGGDAAKPGKFGSGDDAAYSEYFTSFVQRLEERMTTCRQNIEEIDFSLTSTTSSVITPKVLKFIIQVMEQILRDQHASFLVVANKVAIVHDSVQKLARNFEIYRDTYLRTAGGGFENQTVGLRLHEIASNLVPMQQQQGVSGLGASQSIGFQPQSTIGATPAKPLGVSFAPLNSVASNHASNTSSQPLLSGPNIKRIR